MLAFLKRLGFRPYQVVWELTLACNMNCRHCGSRAGKPRPDEPDQENDSAEDVDSQSVESSDR